MAMLDLHRIKTALLSVSDKTGLVDFASVLLDLDIKLITTGGTLSNLQEAGLQVTELSAHTGFPEMMDGRVKTLHPIIHGGLLGRVDATDGVDADVMAEHGIEPIDLLVSNLYPFADTVANPASTFADVIENIDIGGPAMVRSASKNFERVACVVNPESYGALAEELVASGGQLSRARRFELACDAFAHIADYDVAIHKYLSSVSLDGSVTEQHS